MVSRAVLDRSWADLEPTWVPKREPKRTQNGPKIDPKIESGPKTFQLA